MTQEEKIKDLDQRIALMDADNSALAVDLEHYKKVAAGLKGRNKQLSERINHYKELDLEGDKLYEKAIREAETLRIAICGKDKKIADQSKTIDGLYSQISSLKETIASHEAEIKDLKGDAKATEANIEWFNTLPWWRKMFFKM